MTFTVLLEPDPVAGGFTATLPAVPAIVTEGQNEAEALAMATEALSLHLRYLADAALPLPTETTAPILRAIEVAVPNPRAR